MKTISIALMMLMSFCVKAADYSINDGSYDKWQAKLLWDTCPSKLTSAINDIVTPQDLGSDYVASVSETLSYQYFKVTFKQTQDGIELPQYVGKQFIYEFQYWTKDDEHLLCTRVEPVDWVY